jgi:hypothetical protein
MRGVKFLRSGVLQGLPPVSISNLREDFKVLAGTSSRCNGNESIKCQY